MSTRTHFTWSIEQDGKCPCGEKTALVIVGSEWQIDSEDPLYRERDYASVEDEVSGHWCPECQRLVSLSFNSSPCSKLP